MDDLDKVKDEDSNVRTLSLPFLLGLIETKWYLYLTLYKYK